MGKNGIIPLDGPRRRETGSTGFVISSTANELDEPCAKPSLKDVLATVGLVALQFAIGLVGYIVVIVESTNVGACGPTHPCNLPLITVSWYLIPIAVGCAVLFAIAGSIVVGLREAPIWQPAAIGVGVVVVVSIVAAVLNGLSTA
jgi:hypothetical protein